MTTTTHRLDIYIHNVSVDGVNQEILNKLTSIETKVTAMATKQDVLDAMALERQQIIDAFTASNAAQDAAVQVLKDQILALQTAAAAGAVTTAADFAELVAATDQIFNPPTPVLPPPVVAPGTGTGTGTAPATPPGVDPGTAVGAPPGPSDVVPKQM